MKKLLVAMAVAAASVSTPVLAEEMKVVCSNDVPRGAVKLSSPPTVNCEDMKMFSMAVGSGVTIGPDANADYIISQLERGILRNKRNDRAYTMPYPNPAQKQIDEQLAENNPQPEELPGGISSWRDMVDDELRNRKHEPNIRAWKDGLPRDGSLDREWLKADLNNDQRRRLNDLDDFGNGNIQRRRQIQRSCTGWVNLNDIISGKCAE